MKLSTKGQYAVIAMADLAAAASGPVALPDIALRHHLSLVYLEQLFGKLRRHGLVRSIRGQAGGYILAQTPDRVSVADILRAADESIRTTRCDPARQKSCDSGQGATGGTTCLTHGLWAALEHRIVAYLSSVSLADVCAGAVNPPTTEGAVGAACARSCAHRPGSGESP